MFKMITAQSLQLGKQDLEVWHRGNRVIKVELINKTHPYLITYSDGRQTTCDAAELFTHSDNIWTAA